MGSELRKGSFKEKVFFLKSLKKAENICYSRRQDEVLAGLLSTRPWEASNDILAK